MSISDYLQQWLESMRGKVADTTWDRYELSVRLYLKPFSISRRRLDRLQPIDVERLYAEHCEKGASASASRRAGGVLTRSLNHALRLQLINSNPASLVPKPKVQRREMACLTPDELRQFLESAERDRLYALFLLAGTTGMRQGELLGLQWGDFDFDLCQVSVKRAIRERRGKLTVEECKTKGSKRTIALGRKVVESLIAHRAAMLKEGHASNGDWVFPNRNGGLIRKSNLVRQSFKPLLKNAGLPDIRFHDLRHTCASLLLNRGVPVTTVSRMLGHADAHITLTAYAHVVPGEQEAAAQAMSALLSGA